MRSLLGLLGTLLVVAPTLSAQARDFYVDPASGSSSGDGSAARPWRTIQEVFEADLVETQRWSSLPHSSSSTLVPANAGAPVRAGDTIWLRSGHHGELLIQGAYNASPITIAAEPGQRPTLRQVIVRGAGSWVVRGLSISPSHGGPTEAITMFQIVDHSHHGPTSDIVVEECDLFSIADASAWSAAQWMAASSGFQVSGDRVVLRNNRVRNVRFGISVSGEHAHVIGNLVENFSADGLRGLGDYGTFEYNLVQNALVGDPPDTNHDDLFQSWSRGPDGPGSGEVRGVVLRGNVLIGHVDPSHPLRSSVQGIGCFDGFFVDWVIENNIVVVNHWHGITLLGARNARIINNTVVDVEEGGAGPARIMIANHKDGRPSDGLVRNNLATRLSLGDGVEEDHNIIVDDANLFFVDPASLDFHPLAVSPALDQGASALAPTLDIELIPRPQGMAVDVGAYEWHEPAVGPSDAGVDAGTSVDGGARVGDDAGVERLTTDAGFSTDAGAGSVRGDGSLSPDAGRSGAGAGGCAVGGNSSRIGGVMLLFIAALFCRRRRRMASRR